MKYFEVFKAGVYPQGKFTKKQIAEIASNYDPKFCEAPITIDHQQSGPAYGWVEDVKAENDKLKVCFKDVPEEFETHYDYLKKLWLRFHKMNDYVFIIFFIVIIKKIYIITIVW